MGHCLLKLLGNHQANTTGPALSLVLYQQTLANGTCINLSYVVNILVLSHQRL